jgi:hypothetical protein
VSIVVAVASEWLSTREYPSSKVISVVLQELSVSQLVKIDAIPS